MGQSFISLKALSKEFRTPLPPPKGLWNGFKNFLYPQYQRKMALENLSFDVQEGEIVGYIGPNGAGKSTTVKILSGILLPTSGEARIMGKIPWENRLEIVSQLGVVFGQRTQLWWDLPLIESFKLLKDIYRVPTPLYKKNLEHLMSSLEISSFLHTPVRNLSLGQRMRGDIAAALIHSPKILFLDEPTIGLDAVSKFAVRDFIQTLNREFQVTVILTTHDMDDIEALCKRVIVLHEGKLYLDGPLNSLREKVLPERLLILDLLHKEKEFVCDEALGKIVKREGHQITLSFNPLLVSGPEIISHVSSRNSLSDLYLENPPIEQIIAKLYGEKK